MLRQRRRIEQPRAGNRLPKFKEILVPQFAPPKLAKRMHPEKCEPHFLLQIWLDRRPDRDAAVCIRAERIFDPGDIWQIE